MIHERLGADVEIYGVGFSLGANHLLRYLGAHHTNNKEGGIRAAASVSNPFDVMATTIRLKYKMFGIYDMTIRKKLAEPFMK